MAAVMGTAGHIDHGKTSLVRALTGMDCDRLEEEKRRGITIELGFAWLDLPGGERLGIVDVPGHERFVKTMAAGASGIDFVMLVIAADEGVMPQTREHLEICSLLGVKNGFVALSKADLVDSGRLEAVREHIRGFLDGTFLEGCPIFGVSAASGEGVEAVRRHMADTAARIAPRRGSDIFRLPVDRAFSLKGRGTVVTGTVISGQLDAGAQACFMPAGLGARARSLQRHGTEVPAARQGERCAVNVQGLSAQDVKRGCTLALPDTLFPSRSWIVSLKCLASSPLALRQRTEVHFHHGTRECTARLFFYGADRLEAGREALCEVRFAEDMAGVAGDRCIVRACSPLRTVAGGTLVSPLPLPAAGKRAMAGKTELLAAMPRLRDDALGAPDESERMDCARALTLAALEFAGDSGLDMPRLAVATGLDRKTLGRALRLGEASGGIVRHDRGEGAWTSAAAFARVGKRCLERLAQLHDRDPHRAFFPRSAVLGALDPALPRSLAELALAALASEGRVIAGGDGIGLAGRGNRLESGLARLAELVMQAHEQAGWRPPNMKDVLAGLGAGQREARAVLRALCSGGRLVRVREGLYYEKQALDGILERVRQWFSVHDDLDVGDMKKIFGLSRKYLIALLEYMDDERITVRVGDHRHFRGRR